MRSAARCAGIWRAACIACVAAGCGDGADEGAAGLGSAGAVRWQGQALPLSIAQIQGTGIASPHVGRTVSTRGVVTRRAAGGFFMQDPECDVAAGVSCGLFVHGAAAPPPGHAVEVEGRVAEFDPARGAVPGGATLTELTRVRRVVDRGPGPRIAPVPVDWPPASTQALRRVESMQVEPRGRFTVQQNNFLGRYGNVTLATTGRVMSPTQVAAPGAAARDLAARNRGRGLLLDDGRDTQDPDPVPWLGEDGTLRNGDEVDGLVGVLDWGRACGAAPACAPDPVLPRLLPTTPPRFVRANPRPASPAHVGGTYRVASANLDNDFLTPADGHGRCAPSGTPVDCRGARSAAEFARQEAKLVEELVGLGADVIGLEEVQNDGGATLHHLVAALNLRLRAPVYSAVPDPATGLGQDAIRVALIYRPARLRLGDPPASDTSAVKGRAPLGQVFESIGGDDRFGVIVSHFKSKDCAGARDADLDAGDGQGCWNARRVAQAQALLAFASGFRRRTGVDELLLVGDFNAYPLEDPLRQLREAGWVDEMARHAPQSYTYVFDGAAGRLDHVFASPALSPRITGATAWHIDADEPAVLDYTLAFRQPACGRCAPDGYTASAWRASDHDPVLVGIATAAAARTARLSEPADPSDGGPGLSPSRLVSKP